MNSNTKEALLKFIDEVENLAMSVSSVCGTDAYESVVHSGEDLKRALKHDETIP